MSVTITTYKELSQWVDAFMRQDGLRLLFVVGHPGASKSVSFKTQINEDCHRYIKAGRLSGFQLFKQLYLHRNKAILLDDVEDALKKRDTARILMALCETDEEARTIAWFGTETQLTAKKGEKLVSVPQEFTTESRVCVISNEWGILTSRFGALLDRGTVLFFAPSAQEVHTYVEPWFSDPEIFGFIGRHLDEIPRHSIRFYVTSKDLKDKGLDWRKVLLESWSQEQQKESPAHRLLRDIIADPRYKIEKERVQAFISHPLGKSRRMYFYLKKTLNL